MGFVVFGVNDLKGRNYMRKIHIRIFLLLIFSILFVPSSIYSSSIKEEYELQEKCNKSCQEYIKEASRYVYVNYTNHYNNKLNKCFLFSITYDPYIKMVIDVHENKTYGLYSNNFCYMLDKKCKSEKEWNELVKPYMEE